jgi:hypothetical protein
MERREFLRTAGAGFVALSLPSRLLAAPASILANVRPEFSRGSANTLPN